MVRMLLFLHILVVHILIFLCLASCGGGGSSVSVQPSHEFFDASSTQLTAKMDILFVVDNSLSMKEEQENMMANFVSFIKNFVNKGYDYRIATIATDAWVTKGFFDTRALPPVSTSVIGSVSFVSIADHMASREYNSKNFKKSNNDGNSLISYSPESYVGFPDLRFYNAKRGSSYYYKICRRDNYVTSRFSEGDYTKALMGSSFDTSYNGEASKFYNTKDPRYLSGYRIVSSEDSSIDTNFYGKEADDFISLRNRDNGFYSVTGVTKPSGKKHIIDIFRNNVMLGLDGCYGESGLESAKTALQNPFNQSIDPDGSGPLKAETFPRPDAHLAIIIVSDTRDEMVKINVENKGRTIANYDLGSDVSDEFSQERLNEYKDYFESIASEVYGYTVHVIVPTGRESLNLNNDEFAVLDPPVFKSNGLDCTDSNPFENSNCYVAKKKSHPSYPGDDSRVDHTQIPAIDCHTEWSHKDTGNPKEAKMYTKMAEQTGGQKASICGDFSEKLENIAKVIIERTTEVRLDKKPSDPNLLFVSVDHPSDNPDKGFVDIPQDFENGWSYNAVGNTVVFHGSSIPEQEAKISIVFDRDNLE